MEGSVDLRDFAGQWVLDPDRTSIVLHTKALWVFPAKGTAKAIEGGGTVGTDGGVSGTLVIDAASIDTRNKARRSPADGRLLRGRNSSTITFEVTSGRLVGSGKLELTGALTVHGRTRPLSVMADLDVTPDAVGPCRLRLPSIGVSGDCR